MRRALQFELVLVETALSLGIDKLGDADGLAAVGQGQNEQTAGTGLVEGSELAAVGPTIGTAATIGGQRGSP